MSDQALAVMTFRKRPKYKRKEPCLDIEELAKDKMLKLDTLSKIVFMMGYSIKKIKFAAIKEER